MRWCLYCGEPLPVKCSASRLYCCARHRRLAQDERRRDERAEAREAREAGKSMADPWARCDLDEWSAEEVYANALLDPLPVGAGDEAVAGPMAACRPKKRASWKDSWLSLL